MGKVLYVTGVGRSGTTLIEKLIAHNCNVHALGEVELIWARGMTEVSKCGCGEFVFDCEFWSKIITGKQVAEKSEVESSRKRLKSKYLSWLPFFGIIYDLKIVHRLAKNTVFYEKHKTIHDSISANINNKVFSDSSKHPFYVNILNDYHDQMFIVHIKRDLAGYAYSMSKQKTGKEVQVNMIKSNFTLSILRWIRGNVRARLLSMKYPYLFIDYKKFVTNPDAYYEKINRLIGSDNSNRGKAIHQIAGNPSRFENVETIRLKEDRDWKVNQSKVKNFICIFIDRFLSKILFLQDK